MKGVVRSSVPTNMLYFTSEFMMMRGPLSAHGKVVPCRSSGLGQGQSTYAYILGRSLITARWRDAAFHSGLYLILADTDGKRDTM